MRSSLPYTERYFMLISSDLALNDIKEIVKSPVLGVKKLSDADPPDMGSAVYFLKNMEKTILVVFSRDPTVIDQLNGELDIVEIDRDSSIFV